MMASNLAKPKILKVVILGDSGVGKTSLLKNLVNKKFVGKYKSTLGADFMLHELNIDGQQITLQIWDTAGQERFSRLASTYYRGADCCLLVYDVTSVNSFKNLDEWRHDFLTYANPAEINFPCMLVGNKIDLFEKGVISAEKVNKWCEERSLPYLAVSAKDSLNVSLAFHILAKLTLDHDNPPKTMTDIRSVKLIDDPPETKVSKCC